VDIDEITAVAWKWEQQNGFIRGGDICCTWTSMVHGKFAHDVVSWTHSWPVASTMQEGLRE
jgi:hypothetical protein